MRRCVLHGLFALLVVAAAPVSAQSASQKPMETSGPVPSIPEWVLTGGRASSDPPNIGSQDRDLFAKVFRPSVSPVALAHVGPLPPGIGFGESPIGRVVTDREGKTLYALSQRLARERVPARTLPASYKFCVGTCATRWIALAAPADAKASGPWSVIEGAQGPQWAYLGDLVFTFAGDRQPGDVNGDQAEDLWTAIAYLPEPPAGFVAPPGARLSFVDDGYFLTDDEGRLLVVGAAAADCREACADLRPFAAGMASLKDGDWTVSSTADGSQWLFEGRPVFRSSSKSKLDLPAQVEAIVAR